MIRFVSILLLSVSLAACSVTRRAPAPALLDLGAVPAARADAPAAARAPIALDRPEAAPLIDGPAVVWRDGDAGQPQRYAYHRWAAPPAQLLEQRLREVLSRRGPVLARAPVMTPQLQVSLDRFEQVFEGGRSVGRVSARALLLRNGEVLGQLHLDESAPAPSDDAAGGALALRAATDRVVARIDQWLPAQAGAGAQRP